MVPIKEMTDVLKVVKDTGGIKLNSWVRLKRGIFMDDIAQVGGARLWPTLVSDGVAVCSVQLLAWRGAVL